MTDLMKKLSKFLGRGKKLDEKIKNLNEIEGKMWMVENPDDQQAESSVGKSKVKTDDETEELKNRGKLFVGGLCYQTTSKGLEAYFSQFGKVIDAIVMRFPENGKSRGFGFVMFAEASEAESALSINSHVLDGRNIDVRPFVSRDPASNTSKRENDYKVFLGGLPESVSADVLKQFFGRYGEISKIVIPLNKSTKKPKGFGFIWFKNEEDVEKCLAEDFIHLGGRRIHMKRAESRSSSHVSRAVDAGQEIDPDCQEVEDFFADDLHPWDKKSTSSTVDNETSSGTSGERSEDLKLQNLIEDFLSPKLENFNAMNEMKAEEGEGNFKKLLEEFLMSCNEKYGGSDENLISFSDDCESEESSSGTHSGCDSDVSDNECGSDAENDASALDQLRTEFMKMLGDDPSVKGSEISGVNSAGTEDCMDFQTSAPFKFRDNNGSLFCSLCQWIPEDNSLQSFLMHCRTASHRMKLKERFPRERSQAATHTGESRQVGKTDSKPKPFSQKPLAMEQPGISKSQDKIQAQGKGEKLNETERQQKALNTVKNIEAKGVRKKENAKVKNTPNNSKPEEQKNKNKEKSIKGLKVKALAKGMSCIQPASGEQLKCNMCNKIIPKAEDFTVVMKNISQHLQSKRHLKKLLETENLLKESLKKSQEETKSGDHLKNPASQKTQDKASSQIQKATNQKTQDKASSQIQKATNQKTQDKASSQIQKATNQKTQDKASSQIQKATNQKTQDKASSQIQKVSNQGNVSKDNGTKKSKVKNSNSISLFLCIPCNYCNKNIELFKVHLKSEAHLNCFISKGVSPDLSLDNLSKCSSCELFLYGSLYYINKHYSKCIEKKG